MGHRLRPLTDWVGRIQKGDVLQNLQSGTLRIVRNVKHVGQWTSVTFLIMHCSWTGRCYTVYTHREIRRMFRPTGVRMRLNGKWDKQIEAEVMKLERFNDHRIDISCCEVAGMP